MITQRDACVASLAGWRSARGQACSRRCADGFPKDRNPGDIRRRRGSIKMSDAKRRGRWLGGGDADSTDVRQVTPNNASGILIEPLSR
jgi:hypothetical protein